ncbi:uncharacterized protein [Panulirus ornatus]|uniref:uncharacterized protein n=1 Tax=Panulirus ornatus TaxID=150431 RepID=UPI003A881E4E
MSTAPFIVRLFLLVLGISLAVHGNEREHLREIHGRMLSLIQDNILQNVIKELKDTMKVMEDEGARRKLLELLNAMDLQVTKGGKDDKCIQFSLSSDTCSMDFKLARMAEVLPKLSHKISKVKDCPTLLQAAHPIFSNPCICQQIHISKGCPEVMHKIAEAAKIFC